MEIALITGLGFLGKAISDSNKKNNSTVEGAPNSADVYHSNIASEVATERAGLAQQAREFSKDPQRTNIIPPLYPQSVFKRPVQEFGTLTDMASKDSYQYSQMMDALIWKKTKEVAAKNEPTQGNKKEMAFVQDNISYGEKWATFSTEQDMTYDVVDKKDMTFENMEHFTNQRDFSVYNDYNEQRSPHAIELFTGTSKNYFPKKENVELFEPQQDVTFANGMPVMTGLFQDRYLDAVKLERRNEMPFEQRQVGPGIGLDINQDSLNGFHDTTRILPRNIDELRRADKQQESKTEPVNHGKMGDKRAQVTPWKKHLPKKYREYSEGDLLPGSNQFSAARVRDNINLRVGNRIFSQEEFGVAKTHVPQFTNETKGVVQDPHREVYKEPDNLVAGAYVPLNNQNKGSYQINNNQRTNTNIDYVPPASKTGKNATTTLTDEAKATLRQAMGNLPEGAAFGQNRNTKVYNQDEVKQTGRQLLEHFNKQIVRNTNKNQVRFQDDANPTHRQTMIDTVYTQPTNVTAAKHTVSVQDDVKPTHRQTTIYEESGNAYNESNTKSIASLIDEIRATLRQTTDENNYTQPGVRSYATKAVNLEELEESMPVPFRNIDNLEDYLGSGGINVGNKTIDEYHRAHIAISREEVSKGRDPTQSGMKMMATLDNTHVGLKDYQDLQRAWVPTATQNVYDIDLDNQIKLRMALLKDKAYFNDRLSTSLTEALNQNPLVNNQIHHPFRQP